MKPEELLRASRDIFVLVDRPGCDGGQSWVMALPGLHQVHLKRAVSQLRQRLWDRRADLSPGSLKPKALHDSLARSLGVEHYDNWVTSGQHELISFLEHHGLSKPTNLIRCECAVSSGWPLTARQVSDRLFNSNLPLPKRIFTGVGSTTLAAQSVGRWDIDHLAQCRFWGDEDRISFCEEHAHDVVLRVPKAGNPTKLPSEDLVELTGHQLMLHTFGFETGLYNVLGDNLIDPQVREAVFRLYNTIDADDVRCRRIFDVFRSEIERTAEGWIDVLPFPNSNNIVFLRGEGGTFDWVVRDQRDEPFSGNQMHPIINANERPTAMSGEPLEAYLYFKRGDWAEKLEHEAEVRHYQNGGTGANWPGYKKLIERELQQAHQFQLPRPPVGRPSREFVAHDMPRFRLMVSELVSIEQFFHFCEASGWLEERQVRSGKFNFSMDDLRAVNMHDLGHLPVSVTWYDAVVYCRWFENQTGIPVRLLDMEEWREICPPPRSTGAARLAERRHVVIDGPDANGHGKESSRQFTRSLAFSSDVTWTNNEHGLPFLIAHDFGEWLNGLRGDTAPAACAATGESVAIGPLERALCSASSTQSYHHQKAGFRICYVAQADA